MNNKSKYALPKMLLAIYVCLMLFTVTWAAKPLAEKKSYITEIDSVDQFNQIVKNSDNKLLVVDLYADWCRPCKLLSPILEKISQQYNKKVQFYRINVDVHRQLASFFKVTGIPYVVFLKGKAVVYDLTGLYPEGTYIKVINHLFKESGQTDATL